MRASHDNNANIPLDCGFVWTIPDSYKTGHPLVVKVVPVNDVSPIGNSPLTSSGNCSKPATKPGGTTGPSTIPILTIPNRGFYIEMQNRGITFTDEEKAFLDAYPSIRNEVRDYILQTGSKPTIISPLSDEDIDPINLYGGIDPYTGPDPNSCPDCPIVTGPSSGTGIYGVPARSAYPEGSWGNLLYRIDRILFVSSLFPGVGALRAPSVVFRAVTFRSSLNALRARPSGLFDAHHILPQKFQSWFISRGIENIHNPRFGMWWEMNSHRQNAWVYNARWERFIAEHPNASPEEIMQFAKNLMAEFGYDIFWLN